MRVMRGCCCGLRNSVPITHLMRFRSSLCWTHATWRLSCSTLVCPCLSITRLLIARLTPPVASGLVAWLVVGLARRSRLQLFAASILVVPMLPASNILFPVGTVIAERLLYLPSLGLCIAVASAFVAVARRARCVICCRVLSLPLF
jgi:hypothetical protein